MAKLVFQSLVTTLVTTTIKSNSIRPGCGGVVLVAELRQVLPRDHPDPGGEALHQQSHERGDHEHPQQPDRPEDFFRWSNLTHTYVLYVACSETTELFKKIPAEF